MGAGGAGQSLFSYLVANLLGKESHRFLDMHVYYTEEEFRKQGEHLVGKLVVTGQEMPGVAKVLREDPVSVRLPYSFITKQVGLREWKRFEIHAQVPRNDGSHIQFDLQAEIA